MRTLEVFSNAELLRMWSTNCARILFPNRGVGGLDPGHEASFLVLDGDPTANFDAVRSIRLRVKQGAVVTPQPAAQARWLARLLRLHQPT